MTVEQVHDVGGRPTRVVVAGAGPPFVWLHDTLGNRPSPAQERLAERFRVLSPTLPGFEDTDALHGIDGPEDVVFWLLDLFDTLALTRPIVVGCGLGGWMAAELAVRHPERLGSCVLVDAYGLQVKGALAIDEFALTRPMLRPLLFADPNGPLAQDWLPDSEPADRVERSLRSRVASARLAWQFPYSTKLRARLGRAKLPALVIWGEHDRLVPLAHAHAYAKGLPDARLAVLPGAGHYPYLEVPEAFAAEVERFGETARLQGASRGS